MAVIGVKSITGITSITNAAGGADVLTLHSNNTTERMRLLGDSGRLGIGDDNPASLLSLKASNPTIRFTDGSTLVAAIEGDTTQNTFYGYNGADIVFSTHSGSSYADRLRIDSTGTVTIKNSTAAWNKIQRGTATHYSGIAIQESDATQRMQFGVAGGANQIVSGTAQHDVVLKAYDANLILATNSTEKLRITSDGVTTINKSSGSYSGTLHVVKRSGINTAITIEGNPGEIEWRYQDGAANRRAGIQWNAGGEVKFDAGIVGNSYYYRFDTNGTEKLRITSAGNLQQNGGTGISYFKGSGEYIFGSNQSSPPSGGSEAGVQIHSYKTRAHFSINAYMNNSGGPFMQFVSSRSGTLGTLGTKCQNNDYLGEIRFLGDNGTNYNSLCQGASIYAQAASTPADGDTTIGGELYFATGTGSGGTQPVRLTIDSGGRATFTGEVHIPTKLVHDGDQDTNLEFGANTLVLKAGNRTAINCNSNMTEISSPVQYNNSRNYSTNSTSSWTTIFTFSVAGCPGFSMECAARENNYTTIHRVSGSAQWNSVYYTADFAGDSNHAHSSDIMFRVLDDSGTKRLQFKAIQYTTTRTVSIISVWVASGYVTWA